MLIIRYRLSVVMHEVFFNLSERKEALALVSYYESLGCFVELDWVS